MIYPRLGREDNEGWGSDSLCASVSTNPCLSDSTSPGFTLTAPVPAGSQPYQYIKEVSFACCHSAWSQTKSLLGSGDILVFASERNCPKTIRPQTPT